MGPLEKAVFTLWRSQTGCNLIENDFQPSCTLSGKGKPSKSLVANLQIVNTDFSSGPTAQNLAGRSLGTSAELLGEIYIIDFYRTETLLFLEISGSMPLTW